MSRPSRTGIFQRERAFAGYQIGRSIPCQNCAYDLRGLSYGHQCPECGKPAAITLEKILEAEGTESRVADFRQGLRMSIGSWMVYAALLIACLSPVVALLLCMIGPFMRLSALPLFSKTRDALPEDFSLQLQLIMFMAGGTLVTTLFYVIALILLPGTPAILFGILFIFALSVEGFTWLTQLSELSHRLEFPLVGPVARFARWAWISVALVASYLLLSYIIFKSEIAFDLGQLVVVLGVVTCALVTAGVTVTVSDIVRQLAITGELETIGDPILIPVGTQPRVSQPTETDSTPVDVASSAGEKIQVNPETIAMRKPKQDRRDNNSDGPNNPTGVY